MSSSRRSTIIVEHLRKQQMWDSLAKGKRLDGRDFSEQRPLEIEIDMIKKANGSARVKLGDSEVIAGIKVATGEPFEGLENKGALIVTAEVLPTASPHSEPGPPDEEVVELARVVDRGVRESEMIDLDQLALVPGKTVYTIFVDCSVLNADGNLFDATSYAVVASLLTAKLPILEMKDDKVVDTGETRPMPVTTVPVSITAARIGDHVLIDPTAEEEGCMDARITITTADDGFCAIQKGYTGAFTIDQLKKAAETARIKGEEVRARLKELAAKNG
ncbi:MAG: exosome complex protein Rrp42 [Thaumarchaeota archaeon]|nr:MAG: exosome complex protein Rrp42 [Nitrososphaerota archaeon]TLY12028.1 MAG: exosome complex protein Rrp42 [Nitrososphaerota archaeon]HEU0046091.1 exosome complex protein Rrp42 [Nitrososphaera sp.]